MIKRILPLILACGLLFGLLLPTYAADFSSLSVGAMCTVDGKTYATDRYNRCIWLLAGDGSRTLLTGRTEPVDADGRALTGYRDGKLSEAVFGEPCGMVAYRNGLLVVDRENQVLRYVDLHKNTVSTVKTNVTFVDPTAVTRDDNGVLYVVDTGSSVIYTGVDKGTGMTLTALDTGETSLSYPMGICYQNGILYIADTGSHRIFAYQDGKVTTVAGSILTGDLAIEGDMLDGPALAARFCSPTALLSFDNVLYICDSGNGAIRMLQDGYVTTLTDDLVTPDMLCHAWDSIWVGDSFSRTLTVLPDAALALTFDDVVDEQASVVRFTVVNGLMNGTGNGKFSPDLTLTRGMAVTVLARMDGMDTTTSEPYYQIGLQWALDSGISDGANPDDVITCEQFVTMLYRYVGEPAVSDTAITDTTLPSSSEYAVDAYTWASELAILAGSEGIAPQSALTRMEFARILMLFMQNWQG